MLTKLYRIGATHQVIEKPYVVVGVPPAILSDALPKRANAVDVLCDEIAPEIVTLRTGPLWLGDKATRDCAFEQLQNAQLELVKAVSALDAQLVPPTLTLDNSALGPHLVGDTHAVLTNDAIEQAIYCQLLREALPPLIVAFGKAAVSTAGVDQVHSTRTLAGTIAPARLWKSTSPNHLARMEKQLRMAQGLPSLSALEIQPQHTENSTLSVRITALDAQIWLSTLRGCTIVLQALFLKARRIARDSEPVSWSSQKVFEKDRSRASADGPIAFFERTRTTGARAWLDLVLSLRKEFRVLEVTYSEFEGLVLGALLRLLGKPAVFSENDVLRTYFRERLQDGRSPTQWLHLWTENPSADPVQEMNRKRYPEDAERLESWWNRWLADDQALPGLLPRDTAPHRAPSHPVHAKHKKPSSGIGSSSAPKKRHIDEQKLFSQFLQAWESLPPSAPATDRVNVLRAFPQLDTRLGYLISRLNDTKRVPLRKSLSAITSKRFALRASQAVETSLECQQAISQAKQDGVSRLTIAATGASHQELDARCDAFLTHSPAEIIAFHTVRRPSGDKRIQELLLVSQSVGRDCEQ